MPYPLFDRNRLHIKPLAERKHDIDLSHILSIDGNSPRFHAPSITTIAARMRTAYDARQRSRPSTPSPAHPLTSSSAPSLASSRPRPSTLLIMRAHVIRAGVSRCIIDLMERGLITHVAMNGAGPIHDWEFAQIGASTESVARYIRSGEFGLWHETGKMNDAINQGARDGIGMGETLGREMVANRPGDVLHQDVSILAAGYRLRVPVTVHVGIGYDIIHEHANADGAALGATSYRDFLIFTESASQLEGG